MRIAEAARFFAALHLRWNAAQLASDFEAAGLSGTFEVRRMKRAYQRALVLAFAAAAEPELLVVESGEEFDEPPAAALLARAVARVPAALVTFGGEARPAAAASVFSSVVTAAEFEVGALL